MQSQQKKVKWSRGETADALEERTDTGITQVSVSKLENIIADIYGNISRRPAFKIVAHATDGSIKNPIVGGGVGPFVTPNSNPPSTFVFTVNQNKYIIFVIGVEELGAFLIENDKFVRQVNITTSIPGILTDKPTYPWGKIGHASFAQSNNWGILSNVWDKPVILRLTDTDDINIEEYKFSAPWYAPGGTQTKTVSATDLPGLEFNADGQGFTAFAWTDDSGNSSPYSIIDTGLNGNTQTIEESIPIGSIVKFPNMGAYMRVEGYNIGGHTIYFGEYTFDSATVEVPTGSGLCVTVYSHRGNQFDEFDVVAFNNGTRLGTVWNVNRGWSFWVQVQGGTGFKKLNITETPGTPATYTASWQDVTPDELDVQMFGPLLTPVAAANKKDTTVTVEYGYVSLEEYIPTEYTFSQQRLYATKWNGEFDGVEKEIPGYIVGSQIAKYNDFKNDYNTQSEAVVIDISTAYQEKVEYVVDYNGVKIFTSDSEYAYSQQAGVAKQSTNGCSPNCRPIVFGASLLYADKSRKQIRALQYEFQTDIYQSNVINQMCQQDLIYNPVTMISQYDKEHHTGSFLYVIQNSLDDTVYPWQRKAPAFVSCNFVPGNQAQIWSRWTVPMLPRILLNTQNVPTIVSGLVVNNKPWFIITGMVYPGFDTGLPLPNQTQGYALAELSHDNLLDFEVSADPTDTIFRLYGGTSLAAWKNGDNIIYTDYQKLYDTNISIGDPVYNSHGVQIGTIEAIGIGNSSIDYNGTTYTASGGDSILVRDIVMPNMTVSVFDGDQYMWDDTLDNQGKYTKSLADLTNPRVGFMINATLESHPIDIGGKTYTEKKRIGKAVAVIRNTNPGAFTVCDKTGYTSNDKKSVNFYGCTGMKDLIRYTIKNIQGAKFTIESLTMIIEYGTLES